MNTWILEISFHFNFFDAYFAHFAPNEVGDRCHEGAGLLAEQLQLSAIHVVDS